MRMLPVLLLLSIPLAIACKGKQEAAAAPPATTAAPTPPVPAPPATAPVEAASPSSQVTDAPVEAPKALRTDGPGDSLFFSLERTPCFGRCPTYKVRINNDGGATYQGIRSVEREGLFAGRMDRSSMEALHARATAIGFFGMQDKYDSDVTDLPSTIIRIAADGQDKKVIGRSGTPRTFKEFAVYADSVIARVAWVKVQDR